MSVGFNDYAARRACEVFRLRVPPAVEDRPDREKRNLRLREVQLPQKTSGGPGVPVRRRALERGVESGKKRREKGRAVESLAGSSCH